MDLFNIKKIVYLYTPYGKESILVKAGKAYKAGNLGMITTLNEVSYVKSKAKLPVMIEYHVLNSYFEITSSIEKIKASDKPQQITVGWIARSMGLLSKQIDKLPICESEIIKIRTMNNVVKISTNIHITYICSNILPHC